MQCGGFTAASTMSTVNSPAVVMPNNKAMAVITIQSQSLQLLSLPETNIC